MKQIRNIILMGLFGLAIMSCSKEAMDVPEKEYIAATEYIDSIVNGKVLKTWVSMHKHEQRVMSNYHNDVVGYPKDVVLKFASQFPTTRYVVCEPLNLYGRMVLSKDTCK